MLLFGLPPFEHHISHAVARCFVCYDNPAKRDIGMHRRCGGYAKLYVFGMCSGCFRKTSLRFSPEPFFLREAVQS